MKIFKIRASAASKIMTNDRSGKGMGKTAQSYCDEWITEQIFGISKEFRSKYTDKGNSVELESIELAAKILSIDLQKNEAHYENDFVTGTPDCVSPLVEIKSSWDCFTFPLLEAEAKPEHIIQAQCYMFLTGEQTAKIIYTLMDTPYELIQDEIRRMGWKLGFIDIPIEVENEITDRMIFSNKIAPEKRIKVFEVQKDEEFLAKLIERVKQCREYIDNKINSL
jgi:hypothetical protein